MDSNNTSSELTKKVVINTAVVLPIIFICFFVHKYGLTIPYWDQWELVPLLEKMHNHSLTLSDLWAQHNEHRILFPQIVMLFLAWLSNWNISLELYTNIVLGVLIFLFLLSILNNTLKPTSPWLKIFLSLMAFSTVQRENWVWGWQIQMFMSVLGSVIAIWAANKWQGKTIGLVVVIPAAILSSYSFNSGLITWPAVLVVFLLQKKWKLKHIIILILACIATVLLYYYKYTKSPEHPSVLYFLSHPLSYAKYVITYLGASLGRTFSACLTVTIISLVLISLAIFNLWRFDKQKLRDTAPWLAIALYACMAGCATGVGRAGFGYQQVLSSSRYTTISSFLPLAAIILMQYSIRFNLKKNRDKLIKVLVFMIVTLLFTISYTYCYRRNIENMKSFSIYLNASRFCLTMPQMANDYFLIRLYPKPDIAKSRIETLSKLGIKFKANP